MVAGLQSVGLFGPLKKIELDYQWAGFPGLTLLAVGSHC